MLRIGIEPDIVGRAAVRLHNADGINQRDGGLRLRTSKKNKLSLRTSVFPKIGTGVAVWEGTWEEAEAADMQDEREKEAREPSLEAAARRTSESESSLWSKKTARKRVRDEKSRARRMPRRYDASSHSRASIDAGSACAAAVAMAALLLRRSLGKAKGERRVECSGGWAEQAWLGWASFNQDSVSWPT